MKNRKKFFAFLLIFVMLVTCISPQQINAKTTGKKVAVTREAWICALLKQAHIKTGKVSKYHFSDTKKSSKKKVIETAYSRGILPVKKNSKKFYPKKAATREFMAVTTVRALGFQANKAVSPKCKDKKKLKYPAEDKVALNQKIISLKKKQFLPKKAITKAEKKKALRVVKKLNNTGKVNPEHKNVVTYQKDVEQILTDTESSYTVIPQGDMLLVSIPKNENMQQIKSGKVILLPKKTGTDNQLALKVKSVTDAGNGMLQIIGETPDISEVYQKVDIQKEKQADMSMFVPNEDVVASVSNLNSGLKGASIQATVSAENGKIVELKEQKLGTVGTFSGSVELSAPKVTAIVDADFSKRLHPVYREVSVSLNEDITAKAELKFSSKGVGSEKIYVGHVSTYLGDGLYADVVCYLNVSADGKATIQYKLANTLTASYINGDFRISEDSNGSWEGTKAEVNGQLLGEPQLNLRFFGYWFDEKLYGSIDIVGVQADIGPKLKATATVHDTEPKLCTNLDLYGYASIGMNTDFGIGKWLKNHTKITLTKVILDNNAANPLHGTWHYEDGKRTEGDKCTYKKVGTETTNKNNKGKNDLAIKAYKKYMKDGTYKRFFDKQVAKNFEYAYLDIDQDGIQELLINATDKLDEEWNYTAILGYYKNKVKYIDMYHNFHGFNYSKKYKAVVFSDFRISISSGADIWCNLKDYKLVNFMVTGWEVGSDFNEIKNFKDIDDTRIYITEEEENEYFSDVHSVKYTPIAENTIKNKINKANAQLPNALYKKIKGWWTENSSGGYDYKIVKTGFKRYNRTTGKCLATWKVKGCKKTSEGYLIKVKYKNYKASYVYNEAQDVLEYHWDWNTSGDNYSGSSSLSREKWN